MNRICKFYYRLLKQLFNAGGILNFFLARDLDVYSDAGGEI